MTDKYDEYGGGVDPRDLYDGCEYADRCGTKCRGCSTCGAERGEFGIDCPSCKMCRADHAKQFER